MQFLQSKIQQMSGRRSCFGRIGISPLISQAAEVKIGAIVNRRPFFIRALADSRCKDEHFFKPPCLSR